MGLFSTAGPAKFRLQERVVSEKTGIWVQMKSWRTFFRWINAYNVDNERRKAMLEVIEAIENLEDAYSRVALHSDDVKLAKKKISDDVTKRPERLFFSPSGSTSDSWPENGVDVEDEVPDLTKQFESLVKKYDLKSMLDGEPSSRRRHRPHGKTTVMSSSKSGPLPTEYYSDSGSDYESQTWNTQRSRDSSRQKGNKNQNQNNQNKNQ